MKGLDILVFAIDKTSKNNKYENFSKNVLITKKLKKESSPFLILFEPFLKDNRDFMVIIDDILIYTQFIKKISFHYWYLKDEKIFLEIWCDEKDCKKYKNMSECVSDIINNKERYTILKDVVLLKEKIPDVCVVTKDGIRVMKDLIVLKHIISNINEFQSVEQTYIINKDSKHEDYTEKNHLSPFFIEICDLLVKMRNDSIENIKYISYEHINDIFKILFLF